MGSMKAHSSLRYFDVMHYNGMCVTYTTSNKKNEWMWKERRKMQTVGFEPTRANTLRPERSTLDHSVIFASVLFLSIALMKHIPSSGSPYLSHSFLSYTSFYLVWVSPTLRMWLVVIVWKKTMSLCRLINCAERRALLPSFGLKQSVALDTCIWSSAEAVITHGLNSWKV